MKLIPLLLTLGFTSTTCSVLGGTVDAKAVTPLQTQDAVEGDEWWVRIAPYSWLAAMEGDVSIGRLSTPVDIRMGDTLDSLDMAYMGVVEAGVGRWSAGLDVVYAKTSQDFTGGGFLFNSFRFEQKQWLLTPFVAFRAIATDRCYLDLLAGARVTLLESGLTGRLVGGGEVSAEQEVNFADPIIGLRGQVSLTDKLFIRYSGDIGGFGASSRLVWQGFCGLGVQVSEKMSVAAGYRGLGMDYSKGGFTLDTVSHGPVLGLEARF